MVEHVTITDPDLHEPKGVAAATANEVYVADGAASGDWSGIWLHGWEDIEDTGASQSLATSFVDLTNDGAGVNTNNTYKLPGWGDIWNTTTSEFQFDNTGLSIGDTVVVRMDFDITTAGTNSVITTAMDFAHGDASEFELVMDKRSFKTASTHNLIVHAHFYIGSSEVLNNPAKIKMKSDNASDTVSVNGWFVNMFPLRPVFS